MPVRSPARSPLREARDAAATAALPAALPASGRTAPASSAGRGRHLRRRQLRALFAIDAVAGSRSDPATGALEILELFRDVVPYAAASFSAWNPLTDRHETVASCGYPPALLEHVDTWFVRHDPVYVLMRTQDPRPLRWRDMPFDYRSTYTATEFLIPLGFDEGVTTCLYTPDGRYTGSFHVSCDSPEHPTDAAMDAFAVLQSTLAGLLDALRGPACMAATIAPGAEAAILTPSGELVALPGRPCGSHLRGRGPLASVVLALLDTRSAVSRGMWRADDNTWLSVRLEPLDGGTLVVCAPADPPHELTARELEVLTLMAHGASNPQVAATLTISVKTVARHVEHILEKLGAPTRSAAAARAVAEGLVLLRAPVV